MRKGFVFVAVLLALLACSSLAAIADMMANDKSLVDRINNDPTSTWRATEHDMFKGKTLSQLKGHLFSPVYPPSANSKIPYLDYNVTLKDLPESYNPDKEFPECTIGIIDQGQCGSSWAFPVVASVGNRFCTVNARKQLPPVATHYSTQYLLSCDTDNFCCNGGYLNTAYDFIAKSGLPLDSCVSYNSTHGDCPNCPTKCDTGSALHLYKLVKPGTTKVLANVESAMQDIVNYGYISSGMDIYQDFLHYQSGIYQHKGPGSSMGTHGIRIVGYGVDAASKLKYWVRFGLILSLFCIDILD